MNQAYYPAPEEAAQVSAQLDGFQSTAEYCFRVWGQAVQSVPDGGPRFSAYAAVHAVFVAGYLAGMRELRARKKKTGR